MSLYPDWIGQGTGGSGPGGYVLIDELSSEIEEETLSATIDEEVTASISEETLFAEIED